MATHERAPQVGELAPALSLPRLEGGTFDLADRRPGPALVTFLRHAG